MCALSLLWPERSCAKTHYTMLEVNNLITAIILTTKLSKKALECCPFLYNSQSIKDISEVQQLMQILSCKLGILCKNFYFTRHSEFHVTKLPWNPSTSLNLSKHRFCSPTYMSLIQLRTWYTSIVLSTLVCLCNSLDTSPFQNSTFSIASNFFMALSSLLARRRWNKKGMIDSWTWPRIWVVMSNAARCCKYRWAMMN